MNKSIRLVPGFSGAFPGNVARSILAGALVASVVAVPTTSDAVRDPAFTTKDAQKCQSTIGKGGAKLAGGAAKAWAKCFAAEFKGEGACTSIDVSKDTGKFSEGFDKKCGVLDDPSFLTSIGLPWGLSNAAPNLSDNTLSGISQLMDIALSDVSAGAGDSDAAKCYNGIAKALGKALSGSLKADVKCFDSDDKQQVKDPAAPPKCDKDKRAASIAKVRQKAIDGIDKVCSPSDIDTVSGSVFATSSDMVDGALDGARGAVCSWYPQAGQGDLCYLQTERISVRKLQELSQLGFKDIAKNILNLEQIPFEMELSNCTDDGEERTCDVFQEVLGEVLDIRDTVAGGVPTCPVKVATKNREGSITFNSNFDILAFDYEEEHELIVYLLACPTCSGVNIGDEGVCEGNGDNTGEPCISEFDRPGVDPHTSRDCHPNSGAFFDTIAQASGPGTRQSSEGHVVAATEICAAGGSDCHCAGQLDANDCTDGFCPGTGPGTGFCFADGLPISCLPSPYNTGGGDADGNQITLGVGSCMAATASITNDSTGLPGPFFADTIVEVTPLY